MRKLEDRDINILEDKHMNDRGPRAIDWDVTDALFEDLGSGRLEEKGS